MAKGFFQNFPTMMYDVEGNGQYRQVIDIFRRVSLRNNLKDYIQVYNMQNIDGTQKPERLAEQVHGDPHRNWIVMMMNDVENPFVDWYMSESEFWNFMETKYPNKAFTLLDTHSSISIYLAGEELTGTNIASNVKVVRFNATLRTVVYSGDVIPSAVEVTGSSSNTVGTIKTSTNVSYLVDEMYAPHHIDSDGVIVSNWDYEYELNEAKSQVSVLNNNYTTRVEDEFIRKIK